METYAVINQNSEHDYPHAYPIRSPQACPFHEPLQSNSRSGQVGRRIIRLMCASNFKKSIREVLVAHSGDTKSNRAIEGSKLVKERACGGIGAKEHQRIVKGLKPPLPGSPGSESTGYGLCVVFALQMLLMCCTTCGAFDVNNRRHVEVKLYYGLLVRQRLVSKQEYTLRSCVLGLDCPMNAMTDELSIQACPQ